MELMDYNTFFHYRKTSSRLNNKQRHQKCWATDGEAENISTKQIVYG